MKNYAKRAASALLSLCCAVLCACGQPAPDTDGEALPVLTVGSDNYEPYFYLDENGEFAGIDVEIATAACERLGWTASFQKINWQEKDALLERGDVDCLWGSFSMNGREDLYRWAGPYMYSRQVVIVQASSDIYGLGDLNGKRIAVQSSSKPEELCVSICRRFGFTPFLSAVTGSPAGADWEKADVIREAMRRLRLTDADKPTVLMVGDRKYDVLGAQECGLACVGVEFFGYAAPGELAEAGAAAVVRTAEELEQFILNH